MELAWVTTSAPTPTKIPSTSAGGSKTTAIKVEANGDEMMADHASEATPGGEEAPMDFDVAAEENEWDI